MEPVTPLSLATVLARITYDRSGRLRISVGGHIILDRRGAEPAGELFNLGKLDRIMEISGIKRLLLLPTNLLIKPKKANP